MTQVNPGQLPGDGGNYDGRSIVIKNILTNQDINPAGGIGVDVPFIPLFGVVDRNDDASLFVPSLATAEMAITETGQYTVDAYASWVEDSGNNRRLTLRLRFSLGDGFNPPVIASSNFQNNYMADLAGAIYQGQSIPSAPFEVVTAPRLFQLLIARMAGSNGVVFLQGTENYIKITRVGD